MAKDTRTNQIYTKHYPRRFWEEDAEDEEDEEDRDEKNEKRIYQNLASSALQIRPRKFTFKLFICVFYLFVHNYNGTIRKQ